MSNALVYNRSIVSRVAHVERRPVLVAFGLRLEHHVHPGPELRRTRRFDDVRHGRSKHDTVMHHLRPVKSVAQPRPNGETVDFVSSRATMPGTAAQSRAIAATLGRTEACAAAAASTNLWR